MTDAKHPPPRRTGGVWVCGIIVLWVSKAWGDGLTRSHGGAFFFCAVFCRSFLFPSRGSRSRKARWHLPQYFLRSSHSRGRSRGSPKDICEFPQVLSWLQASWSHSHMRYLPVLPVSLHFLWLEAVSSKTHLLPPACGTERCFFPRFFSRIPVGAFSLQCVHSFSARSFSCSFRSFTLPFPPFLSLPCLQPLPETRLAAGTTSASHLDFSSCSAMYLWTRERASTAIFLVQPPYSRSSSSLLPISSMYGSGSVWSHYCFSFTAYGGCTSNDRGRF